MRNYIIFCVIISCIEYLISGLKNIYKSLNIYLNKIKYYKNECFKNCVLGILRKKLLIYML